MKIHEYNEMMSYLTRPAQSTINRNNFAIGGGAFFGTDLGTREGFNSYTKKLVTPEFLKASKTKLENLTPEQRKLYNKKELYVARVKTIYDPETKTHKLTNVFGNSDKIDYLLGDKIPEDLSKLPDELSGRSVAATKIRQKFIEKYLKDLPKGKVINLDATVRKLNETIQEKTNGKISITDKKILMDSLEDKSMNPNKVRAPKDLKEAKKVMFEEFDVPKETIDSKAEELNKKYNLADKGISFTSKPTSGGKNVMALVFSGAPFREKYKTVTKPFSEDNVKELEKILEPITKTKLFKNYSAIEEKRKGSRKAGQSKLKYNQPELFDYLLNKEGPISKEEVIKELGYDDGSIRKAIGNLHANMYRALDPNQPGSGKFLSDNYNSNQIKNVLDKVKNNFPGDFFNRTFEELLIEAYGENEKKYKPLADKLKKFRTLQKKLKDAGVGQEFLAQLDHVIPFNFLQQIRAGKDPSELLRVKAYPGTLNSMAFKGSLDKKLGEAVEKGDKELIKTINELRSFLPEDMGQVSTTGKRVIDYGAKPFNLKTIYADQQKKFGEVYERTQEFINNPRVQELLKNAGISFKAIRDIRRLNVPGFIDTFNKILKQNPDLRVELQDPFSEIENQYASASMISDISPVKKETDTGVPYEAAAPAAMLFGKYAKPIAKTALAAGKGLVRPIIAPAGGAVFAISELLSEDPSQALAGLELLYPEIIKQASGKVGSIKNVYDKALALSPNLKYAPQVSRGMSGLGTLMIGADILQGLDKRIGLEQRGPLTEQELLDMREKETYMGGIADAFDKAYREGTPLPGRTGFADGPEDPSKRKFMKIMGGLASLPIVGRFIKVGEQAPAVVETFKGAPEWFGTLVDKVIRTGTDMTKSLGFKDRQEVYGTKISDDEMVIVYKDLETGNVKVEYQSPENMGESAVDLNYKAPEQLEDGTIVPAEFNAVELEPRGIRMGPDDYDIEFDGENVVENIDDLNSDLGRLEFFATDKMPDLKKIEKSNEKRKRVQKLNEDTMEQAEYLETKYGPGDEGDPNFQDFSDYD